MTESQTTRASAGLLGEPVPFPTVTELVDLVWRARRHFVLVPAAVATAVLAGLLLEHDRFAAAFAVVPETRSGGATAQLASLAALAGVSLSSGPSSQTPQFYAGLLTSRPILYAVVQRRYPGPSGDSVTLSSVLRVKGANDADRLARAARELLSRTEVSTDLKTGVIRAVVEMPTPQLAADVANAFLEELNQFNGETRQTQARARRVFVEGQVREAERDLATAENAVRSFVERNRLYAQSPALQFEYTRLERAYTIQSELYLELRRQLDAARIAEVDDVPTLTTIERAIPPTRKSGPHRLRWVLSAYLGSALLLAFWLVTSRRAGQRSSPNDSA